MKIDSNWASIVERYLQAYYQENKLHQEARLTNSRANVFREFATELIAEAYFERIKQNCESLIAASPSSEWKLITDSEQSVMVEIPVETAVGGISNQVPFFTTRFLLTRQEDGEWRIADILNPCVSCNVEYSHSYTVAGQCSLCESIGHLRFEEDDACDYCSGTGKCPKCKDESIVGWRRAAFLCPSE